MSEHDRAYRLVFGAPHDAVTEFRTLEAEAAELREKVAGLERERDEAKSRNADLAVQLRDEKLKRSMPPSAFLARAEAATPPSLMGVPVVVNPIVPPRFAVLLVNGEVQSIIELEVAPPLPDRSEQ